MKITADLIGRATSYINPVKDRELDLHGLKIPAIENLGVTQDLNAAINFNDNEIRRLENFPLMRRLRSIYLSNNRIQHIAPGLEKALPSLEWLVLSNNQLSELADIEPLSTIKSLRYLSLIENPVTRQEHYRLYAIYKLPFLRVLDFQRIKNKEREAAKRLFEGSEGKKLEEQVAARKAKTFVPGGNGVLEKAAATTKPGLSPDEVAKIKEAIKAAKTLEEVARLERILKTGTIPTIDQIRAPRAPAANGQQEVEEEEEEEDE